MTQFTLPLDIDSLEIIKQTIDSKGNIIFDVVSKNDHSTFTHSVNYDISFTINGLLDNFKRFDI